MVFTFEYKHSNMLQAITKILDDINNAGLKEVQGSLKSHQLSPIEVEQAQAGSLDVVGGFHVIDDDSRMIVIEGLKDTIDRVAAAVPRPHANDRSVRILSDANTLFHKRLYSQFNVDLKKIKLRDPLPDLCQMPEMYNRSKVSPECFNALHSLLAIRNANRMNEVAVQTEFPPADDLIQIESKYGESISLEDITGEPPSNRKRTLNRRRNREDQPTDLAASAADFIQATDADAPPPKPPPRKAPTDATNPDFERSLRQRNIRDFLAEQTELVDRAKVQFHQTQSQLQAELDKDPVSAKFTYSGQALQFTRLKKDELRAKLGRRKDAHFTYSKDYLSAAVAMVDDEVPIRTRTVEKSKWKTARGFVYPAPRPPTDFIAHPHKPSESRIAMLAEPWVENELHPKPVSRDASSLDGPDFNSLPVAGGSTIFGGFRKPAFARSYDNNHIGDPRKLPRGKLTLEKDPKFFSSVHLSGDGLQKEMEEEAARQRQAWMDKWWTTSRSKCVVSACATDHCNSTATTTCLRENR